MKVSRAFLGNYVDIKDQTTFQLAEAMTHVGNEYASIDRISEATNLVVGYVKECKMHPDSDHLHVCQVEIKPDEIVQIVCGAPNVREDTKVIVSLPGATLPGGITIKKSTIRGQESNGMICSLSELGIDSKYQSEEDKTGIHILDHDAPVGADALKYLGYDDEVIDFELTSNRSDLLSMLGMAHEVGAILKRPVIYPDTTMQNEEGSIDDLLTLEVQTKNCPLYLARVVKNVTIGESPKWMKEYLMASGIRPINNVVDISNFVMLEYGQPLHFFDLDHLGNKVIVRMAEDGEKMTTLDHKERVLSKNDIVIANEQEAVCLAGVMGGYDTEVEPTTQNIMIESAIFDPGCIRTTAKTYWRSEASNRMEKGLDPNRTYAAMERACHLLEKYASGTVVQGMKAHDKVDKQEKEITITVAKINQVMGVTYAKEEIIDVFRRLGFQVKESEDQLTVLVPTRRLDVNIPEDLIEEVGRIAGIDKVPSTMPHGEGLPGTYEKAYLQEKQVRSRLLALGLNQVETYSLTSIDKLYQFTLDTFTPIKMQDPMQEDKAYLRHSLIPSLLNVCQYNLSRANKDVHLHEISNIYYFEDDKVIEKKYLAGILTGKMADLTFQHQTLNVDFYYTKGIVENLLKYMGLNRRYKIVEGQVPKEYHPYQSAVIMVDRDIIGYMGMIHPSISKPKIFAFEIDLSKLFAYDIRPIKDKEIPKYPSIEKDMAFIVDLDVTAKTLEDTLQKAGGRLLSKIEVFDVYTGENVEAGKKSIAFHLTFQDPNRTLTEEEVMKVFHQMIAKVEQTHNAVLRDK